MINGKILHDKIDAFFENSTSTLPQSLKGELLQYKSSPGPLVIIPGALTLMKAHDPGYWYEARMNVTNVNIFSDLATEELIDLTTAGVCLHQEAVEERLYLAWPEMKWKVVGSLETFNISTKEFCSGSASENSSMTLLSGG